MPERTGPELQRQAVRCARCGIPYPLHPRLTTHCPGFLWIDPRPVPRG
jgi:hypothetical protein